MQQLRFGAFFSNLVLRLKSVYHKAIFWIVCWDVNARFLIRRNRTEGNGHDVSGSG